MAQSGKYGCVDLQDDRGIEDTEPVFVLAAHDKLAVSILETYRMLASARGEPTQKIEGVQAEIEAFQEWQLEHGTREPSIR